MIERNVLQHEKKKKKKNLLIAGVCKFVWGPVAYDWSS